MVYRGMGEHNTVLCLQMGAETSLTVFRFLIELPALDCMDGQPHLVRWKRLFLSLSKEGRKEAMRGEVETKSQLAAPELLEKALRRLSMTPLVFFAFSGK